MPPNLLYYNCSKGERKATGCPHSQGTKKIFKKVEKKLDNLLKICYNKDVKRIKDFVLGRCSLTSKAEKTLKKIKKPLDNLKKICYNKYVS